MRPKVEIALLIVLIFTGTSYFIYAYSQGTGFSILWETQEAPSGDYFSQGFPDLSPETLPTVPPAEEAIVFSVACEEARRVRDDACMPFKEDYPSGCQWWHVSWASSCKERAEACRVAQDAVMKAC